MDEFKKKGLGRGIATLLGNVSIQNDIDHSLNSNLQVLKLPLESIIINKDQPRKRFNEIKLKELSISIQNNGLLQPIIVMPKDDKYLLVAGERRLRATKMCGMQTINAIVLSIEEKDILKNAILENIQREDLNVVEEAIGYRSMIQTLGYTHDSLSNELGKSRSHITNVLRILNLPQDCLDALKDNKITFGHAKVLLSADHPSDFIQKIYNNNLTVRELENLLSGNKNVNSDKNLVINDDNIVEDDDFEDVTYSMIKNIYNSIADNITKDNENQNLDNKSLNNDNDDKQYISNTLKTTEEHIRKHTGLDLRLNINSNHGTGRIIINYVNANELMDILKKFFI